MENSFNDVPSRLVIPNPKAIISRNTKKIETPIGTRFFCRKRTSGLQIVAIKIASKKGIRTSCAARIPATTITKAAQENRIDWVGLIFLFDE